MQTSTESNTGRWANGIGSEKARGSQILVSNGKLVDPFALVDDDIDVWMLCRSMAQLNRYTGHCLFPYSVAQHTRLLASIVPEHLRRVALVHDMSEPLTNDISRPVKRKLPEFVAFEAEIQDRILDHFGIDPALMEELHAWDLGICQDEMMQLFDPPYDMGLPSLGVVIRETPWMKAAENLFDMCMENDIV